MPGIIDLYSVQLGKRIEVEPSNMRYSYDGGVTVEAITGSVTNPTAPITNSGTAHIDGNAHSTITYDLGKVYALWELWAYWDHIGDNHVMISKDDINWINVYYNRISWADPLNVMRIEQIFASLYSYPTPAAPPAYPVRYIKFTSEALILIGDYTELAYFWWVSSGGIYTYEVDFTHPGSGMIATNGVRHG
jgi:hypothetical protein